MLFKFVLRLIAMGAIAVALCGCAPSPTQPAGQAQVYYEGLEQVDARGVDIAFVRPGIDFRAYTGLLVEEPELAFRTPDRSKRQFPLTKDQKTRFRDLLAQKFRIELAKSKQLKLVEQAGPDVLRLRIRVQDILVSLPSRNVGSVGLAGFVLEAIGEATIVLELRDSQSEETLARAADTRAVEGAAILQKGGPLTSWSEVETLCERWASTVRKRLDRLVEGY
jgi:hypothetical protein